MKTTRTIHDFGELSHEDVADLRASLHATRSMEEKVRANIYPTLLTAFAAGLVLGYLTCRKNTTPPTSHDVP